MSADMVALRVGDGLVGFAIVDRKGYVGTLKPMAEVKVIRDALNAAIAEWEAEGEPSEPKTDAEIKAAFDEFNRAMVAAKRTGLLDAKGARS